MSVGPCARCARHVRIGEARCPFCGAEARAVVGGAVRGVSRRELTRAAVFASAAVVMGCGSSEPEAAQDDTTTSGGEGGDPPPRDPECDLDPRRCRELPECVHDGTCPAPPYGAPPAETIV